MFTGYESKILSEKLYRIEHAITMILVLLAAHLPASWKKAPASKRFRNTFFVQVQ